MNLAPVLYTIRIDGHLDPTLLSAFPAVAARQEGAHTLLTGMLDQSALFGVLAEVEALGLCLLEVRRGTSPQPPLGEDHHGARVAPTVAVLRQVSSSDD